jgi:hypothetical protein
MIWTLGSGSKNEREKDPELLRINILILHVIPGYHEYKTDIVDG